MILGERVRLDFPPLGAACRAGFGFRGSIDQMARKIDGILTDLPGRWPDLILAEPELGYFDWNQLQDLRRVLRASHNITLVMSEDRFPLECGRSA